MLRDSKRATVYRLISQSSVWACGSGASSGGGHEWLTSRPYSGLRAGESRCLLAAADLLSTASAASVGVFFISDLFLERENISGFG